jgi:hypothetical protein
MAEMGQKRASVLSAECPLPPAADIGVLPSQVGRLIALIILRPRKERAHRCCIIASKGVKQLTRTWTMAYSLLSARTARSQRSLNSASHMRCHGSRMSWAFPIFLAESNKVFY